MNKRFWMGVSLVAGLLMSGQALAWENEVPHAAPYIDKALSQPFETLRKTAYDDLDAHNAFTLGLALFAGRGTDGDFTAADEKALEALDIRIAPEVEAYIKRNPKKDHGRVDWRKELKTTPEEISLIGRYQAAYIPEFWLGWAMSQVKVMKSTRLVRPTVSGAAMGELGAVGVGSTVSTSSKQNIIPWRLYTVATQCVSAVRKAAGYSIVPLNDMPLSIRLLRNHITFDVEHRVMEDGKPVSKYRGLKGAAACGTPEQFDAYVAKLKAAD